MQIRRKVSPPLYSDADDGKVLELILISIYKHTFLDVLAEPETALTSTRGMLIYLIRFIYL